MAKRTTKSKPNRAPARRERPSRSVREERKEQDPWRNWSEAGALAEADQIDDWVRIEPDGTVTVFSGKVELGTGTRTALGQIAAEELDVPLERLRVVMGDTAQTPNEGYTAGSKTIQYGGAALRRACAEARLALLEMASDHLDAAVEELTVQEGTIRVETHPDRSVSYAELLGGKRFDRRVTGKARPKPPASYQIVGRPSPRVDIPLKLTGVASFVQDIRLPGMLHGRMVKPPSPGARLVSVDESAARQMEGVVAIVHQGNLLGVVAEREEQAMRAAAALKASWEERASLPPLEELADYLRGQPTSDSEVFKRGRVATAYKHAAASREAEYLQPYHAHASLGPSCAVADYQAGRMVVWSSTQGVYPLRNALAELVELPPEQVRVIHVEGAGCYGNNGFDDAAADAAVLSRAVGRPVRVQWGREEEFAWEPKSPAMVIRLRGAVDEQGRVSAWEYDCWSPTHAARAQGAGDLIAGQLLAGQEEPERSFFLGGDRNAPTNYTFPNQRVTMHWIARSPLRASAMRSLGATGNTFANESFMDELARAAGIDPLEFRLRHLDDPRARQVLRAVAEGAGWAERSELERATRGLAEGMGLAFARYENEEAYVAAVARVEVDTESGAVRVRRITVAHDCGLIINPDGLKNQIEGNVIQSTSRALKEQVTFDRSRITSLDWESYPILKFSEVPEVEVILIDRPDQPAVGAGEVASITTAPAIANAIYDACGARVRQAPFTPDRVLEALRAHS